MSVFIKSVAFFVGTPGIGAILLQPDISDRISASAPLIKYSEKFHVLVLTLHPLCALSHSETPAIATPYFYAW